MFDLFKRGRKDKRHIRVESRFTENGIAFTVKELSEDQPGKQVRCLELPVVYRDYFDLENLHQNRDILKLQLLEELYDENFLIQQENGSYFLSLEELYEQPQQIKRGLGLLSDDQLKIELNSDLAVGNKNFTIDHEVHYPELGYISNFGKRIGAFYISSDDKNVILLAEERRELLELVDSFPVPVDQQPEYVARIKTLGTEIGVKFDPYLEQEEYYFPQQLDVEVEEEALDSIRLEPKFADLDDELNIEATKEVSGGGNYATTKKRGRSERVFIDKEIRDDFTEVEKIKNIEGSMVPRFVQNPAQYLPDSIDLERFSERVKGLKERVYKAQPYIREDGTGIDWFDIEPGVKLKSEDEDSVGEEDGEQLEAEEFQELVEQAQEEGEEYVLWENKWVKVPEDGEEFIEAQQELDAMKNEEGRIDKTNLPYIFDIYDNVDDLEYSLEILEEKQELKKAGVLEYNPPTLLDEELYSFQEDGYLWLRRLEMANLGGLLADDMGLGKTIQIISLMAFLKESDELAPSLVVAPRSLLTNWKKEISKFCSAITEIYIHHGPKRLKQADYIDKSDVVITTYRTLVSDQLLLGEIDWQLVVCDEAQQIKNKSTLSSQAVKAQKANFRLALTGTPVENDLSDLWSILDFAQPGLLDSFSQFKSEYIKPMKQETDSGTVKECEKKLKTKIRPVYLRRTKENELKSELPQKYQKIHRVKMSSKQKQVYEELLNEYKKSSKKRYLEILGRLLSICSHPELDSDEWENRSVSRLRKDGPKLDKLIELLAEVRNKNEKAIIFTFYIDMQYIIKNTLLEVFDLERIPVINGQSRKRSSTVDEFNSALGFGCMILSPRAAGTGLNITGANHVFHYSRWWNPAVEKQATDRVYRIGQEKDVHIHYLITEDNERETVEEKLNRLLEEKKELAESIIVPNKEIEQDIKRSLLN